MMKRFFLYKIRSVINNNRVINRYRGDGTLFNLGTGNIRGIHNNNILDNEQTTNILANENSDTLPTIVLKDVIKGGYKGYSVLSNFGNVQNLLDNSIEFNKLISDFLKSLDGNNTYTLLSVVRYFNYESGQTEGLTIGSSIKVNSDINNDLLCRRLTMDIKSIINLYGLYDLDLELVVTGRIWLSNNEFKVRKEQLTKKLNEVINDGLKIHECKSIPDNRKNILKEDILGIYKDVLMDNYGIFVENKGDFSYYKFNDDLLEVKDLSNTDNKGIIRKEVRVKVTNINDKGSTLDNIIYWIDIRIDDNSFIRELGKVKFYYENDKIIKIEGYYNFPNLRCEAPDLIYNDKIGSIDFETFGNKDNGFGEQIPYAGGWATKSQNRLSYINKGENYDSFVLRVINSIFEYNENNNYTFYAHNLGRFDSLILIKGLAESNNYKIKPLWKDNMILSIKIKNIETGISINILDSLQILKGKLRDILIKYECNTLKGIFPYRFMNEERLFYEGNVPKLDYFDGIELSEYESLYFNNNEWNAKSECLKYLSNDVNGLLEVMHLVSKLFFDKYSLNITNYRTLPSSVLAAFTCNYYDEDFQIKMTNGFIEKDIRTAYFGGNVDVFDHKVPNGAVMYDMNSQYPNAMLEDMPVGNPIHTTETDINNFFGFAYGTIYPPTEDILPNLYIQFRDENGSVSCPRFKFKRLIFSEEIKFGIKEGYKFDMEWGYKFERGKKVFDKFVREVYSEKKYASNPIVRNTSKLQLNSLQGKFAQKNVTNNMKIIKKNEIKDYTKRYNYQYMANLSEDLVLIKYNTRMNEKLRILYKESLSQKEEVYSGLYKMSGVPSAVQITGAIASYARISINKFKNIKGNTCYYSDTDSVILKFPLNNEFIGDEIGQMKTVYDIIEGILIRKKLYALITKENGVVIKSSGLNPRKLTYENFKELLSGKTVEVKSNIFNVDWSKVSINYTTRTVKLKGVTGIPTSPILGSSLRNKGQSNDTGAAGSLTFTRKFSSSVINKKEGNNINNISLDLSKSPHIINREGGLYKIFDNLYINDNIVDKITEVLEDLYDNNEFTEFNLHFLIKPNFSEVIKFNVTKLNEHLSSYPSAFLNKNISRVYKNTGLINSISVLVFMSFYDINNLNKISKDINVQIKENIKIINESLHINENNTILNFVNKVKDNQELLLIINANYKTLNKE